LAQQFPRTNLDIGITKLIITQSVLNPLGNNKETTEMKTMEPNVYNAQNHSLPSNFPCPCRRMDLRIIAYLIEFLKIYSLFLFCPPDFIITIELYMS